MHDVESHRVWAGGAVSAEPAAVSCRNTEHLIERASHTRVAAGAASKTTACLGLAFVWAACSPATSTRPTLQAPAADGTAAPSARGIPPEGNWWSWSPLERARVAFARGDLGEVAHAAWDARGSAEDSDELRALGARAALGIDCADQAVELAGETRDPELLRVVVRAHLTRDRWREAAVIAAMPELVDDEEARSVIEVARAAAGRALWQVTGASCAEAPLRPGAPVPVVEVEIGGERLLALVDTTTHTTRIARERASSDGVLDTLTIGGVSVAGVPYFARDLSRERALATQRIDVVLGRDLLFRWRVLFVNGAFIRLGGPAQYPSVRSGEPLEPITLLGEVPAVMLVQTQSRAIPNSGETHYRTVGWVALDTTSTTAVTLAERLLQSLPFEHDEVTDMSSLSLEIDQQSREGPVSVQPDAQFPFAPPIHAALGWPGLQLAQLGWRWYSWTGTAFLFLPNELQPCAAPLRSGPRTRGECSLERRD